MNKKENYVWTTFDILIKMEKGIESQTGCGLPVGGTKHHIMGNKVAAREASTSTTRQVIQSCLRPLITLWTLRIKLVIGQTYAQRAGRPQNCFKAYSAWCK